LIERAGIRPAPYLGHRNWVMLDRLDALPGEELRGAIRQSYEMVCGEGSAEGRQEENGEEEVCSIARPQGEGLVELCARSLRLRLGQALHFA
jgi:hypothetical protein